MGRAAGSAIKSRTRSALGGDASLLSPKGRAGTPALGAGQRTPLSDAARKMLASRALREVRAASSQYAALWVQLTFAEC